MTAILAIFNRNGQPVDPSIVDVMLAPSRYRGQDGQDVWSEGSVALAHQHFWFTPEEKGERQPLADPSGRYIITCDARLDNREALIEALGNETAERQTQSDASLVLRAFQRWGVSCAEYLLGAFVFAIWDRNERRLFVARDALGERNAYYYLDEEQCLVASDISQVLAHPAITPQINEGKIAEYLDGVWTYEEETHYRDIFRCPPAHCVLVSGDSFRKWRYWDLDPGKRIRYRASQEYAEHFRSLLTEAVRCRLRTGGPVGVSMSGGLDSTSIAAVAAGLLPETGHEGERLKSFSYVFDELSSCDERQYIQPVVDHCGMDATFILSDNLWTLRDLPHWPVYRDTPSQDCFVWLRIAVLEAAQAAGCRLLLSGLWGDELFYGATYWAADVIRERRFAEVLPGVARNLSVLDWRQDFVHNGLRLLVPRQVRRAYRWLRPRPQRWSHPGLHPSLIARAGLRERRTRYQQNDRFSGPARWHRYRILIDDAITESVAVSRQLSLAHGMESVDPFLDRRLFEFSMGVPADQLGLPHRSKRMLRDAMSGLLPDVVRERPDKTTLGPLFDKGLLLRERSVLAEILRDTQIVQREFVRPDWLEDELNAGSNWSFEGYYLWVSLCLELWLDRYWS